MAWPGGGAAISVEKWGQECGIGCVGGSSAGGPCSARWCEVLLAVVISYCLCARHTGRTDAGALVTRVMRDAIVCSWRHHS